MTFYPTTSTAGDVATHIKRQFGDEAQVQITDSDIIRWINMAQRDLCTTNEVNKVIGVADLVAGQGIYDLSATMKILRVVSIHVNNMKIDFMAWSEYEKFINNDDPGNKAQGQPLLWTTYAGQIVLYPSPQLDSVGGLQVFYNGAPDTVTGLTDLLGVPDQYYNRIIEYCMAQAFELDEDQQGAQFKLGQFSQGLQTQSEFENTPNSDPYPTISLQREDDYWEWV